MNKKILFKEINKEIKKLNNNIDKKILKGRSYEKEARRHRELLLLMQQINKSGKKSKTRKKYSSFKKRVSVGKSPVRKSLKRGVMSRIFTRKFVY